MANVGFGKRHERVKSLVLHAAAQMFLEKGYQNSTMKELATTAGVNYGSLTFAFKSKENIVCELVGLVFDAQFEAAERLTGHVDDKILFYAAETTLQLYMAERSEHMREMYTVSYSMPASAQVIYRKLTEKLQEIFKENLPDLAVKDFYELEIASAGIMRNFLSVPCDMYFTMDRKVKRFLETTFLVYRVPDKKIQEAIEFVSQFDFVKIAEDVTQSLFDYLQSRT